MAPHDHSPCAHCIAKSVCVAHSKGLSTHPAVGISHKIFDAKDYLYHAGERFEGIYTLRSGAAKSSILVEDGQEQIINFHFPGSLLGSDGFEKEKYVNEVQFLQTSSVCFFSAAALKSFVCDTPSLATAPLLKAMSKEINADHRNELNLSQFNSTQRVASFLLDISDNFSERGLSPDRFELAMSRTDIANYLGIAIETLSRLLKKFQAEGIVSISKRDVQILDRAGLELYRHHTNKLR